MRVKWASFCNCLGGPFSRKGVPQKEIKLTDGLARCFAAILEHSGQLKKPGLELLQVTRRLYGEIMTQTKKRKAIETVKGYIQFKVSLQSSCQISVVVSDVFEYFISKKSTYPLAYFFCAPLDTAK